MSTIDSNTQYSDPTFLQALQARKKAQMLASIGQKYNQPADTPAVAKPTIPMVATPTTQKPTLDTATQGGNQAFVRNSFEGFGLTLQTPAVPAKSPAPQLDDVDRLVSFMATDKICNDKGGCSNEEFSKIENKMLKISLEQKGGNTTAEKTDPDAAAKIAEQTDAVLKAQDAKQSKSTPAPEISADNDPNQQGPKFGVKARTQMDTKILDQLNDKELAELEDARKQDEIAQAHTTTTAPKSKKSGKGGADITAEQRAALLPQNMERKIVNGREVLVAKKTETPAPTPATATPAPTAATTEKETTSPAAAKTEEKKAEAAKDEDISKLSDEELDKRATSELTKLTKEQKIALIKDHKIPEAKTATQGTTTQAQQANDPMAAILPLFLASSMMSNPAMAQMFMSGGMQPAQAPQPKPGYDDNGNITDTKFQGGKTFGDEFKRVGIGAFFTGNSEGRVKQKYNDSIDNVKETQNNADAWNSGEKHANIFQKGWYSFTGAITGDKRTTDEKLTEKANNKSVEAKEEQERLAKRIGLRKPVAAVTNVPPVAESGTADDDES